VNDWLWLLALVWVLWQNRKQRKLFMSALSNLQDATLRLNKIEGEVIAAINAPKGVPEADVQLQADNVNASVDHIVVALHPVP